MQAIENLLWRGMLKPIEDRKDIILSMPYRTVLFENLQRYRNELKDVWVDPPPTRSKLFDILI